MPRKTSHPAVPRNVCFVTGTRAEFGLMQSVLHAIGDHHKLSLQTIATGMHLDARHGNSIDDITRQGWRVDRTVPWGRKSSAHETGLAISRLAESFNALSTDVVIVVGDRVEAFAAATAGHLSGRVVAHIHGGDRALGQVDDSLRHAITKLSHVHFPATRQSARRIARLGEEPWRIHMVGSPGIDGITSAAADADSISQHFGGISPGRYALLVLHPADSDENLEMKRAGMVLSAARKIGFDRIVIIYPNNDPGSAGIIRCWESQQGDRQLIVQKNVARPVFLGLLRDAAVLVGNSSSGIIEAASFGTPVVDIGPRQLGRERCKDVRNVPYGQKQFEAALHEIWNEGRPRRSRCHNVYGGNGAGKSIAAVLAGLHINQSLVRKLIGY